MTIDLDRMYGGGALRREALASVFDTNGDSKLTAADDSWASFKVMVTNDDGTTSVLSLDDLGITEIDLTGDATNIELPDGSVITGRTSFVMNGQTHTVGEWPQMAYI